MSGKKKHAVVAVQKQELKPKIYEPTKYKNSSHMGRVFQFLQFYRNGGVLCDIKLETDDGKIILGHKVVFISASPYFRAMFTLSEEVKKDHINIREVDFKVLQLLVDYMYTGEITITEENVQDIVPAADLLQLDYVKRACVGSLQKQLDPSNCIGIKAFAGMYNCTELLSISEEFIKKQFLEVVKYDEFLSLSSGEVIKLISCHDISVPLEEKVFECVMNWVKHKLNRRKDFLPDLMEHVRLPLVSKEYMLEKVVNEPLLKNNPKCKDYVFEALHFNLMNSVDPASVPKTIRSKPRPCSLQKVVLVFSWSPTTHKSVTNWYDPVTNLWHIAPEINRYCKECPTAAGLCVIKDKLVFSVGSFDNYIMDSEYLINQRHIDNFARFRSFEMLDVSSRTLCWVPKIELSVSRQNLGVGALDNCIYAVGGFDANNIYDYYGYKNNYYLNSVEVFNFSTQKWRMSSSILSSKRSNFGIGVLNNLIYAVGGYNGSSYLKSVECYNPSIDKWNPVAEMSVCRCNVSVGVLDGLMYAIGGTNESVTQKTVQPYNKPRARDIGGISYQSVKRSVALKSVEAYSPSAGVWKSIPDMHLGRENAGVFTLDGLLYVMGGKNGSDYFDSVEIYNPKTNSWSMKKLSTSHLPIYGAVVVDRSPHLRIN
ncbi:kelch-like protein 2 isoform X1 [Acyrthosiphon pisum]|uniref:Kelch-like protein diablo n=1 Tax=Acyrthosiphon pisum TaxID=7029 RepID=A0A8R2H5P2_ACYPI|nr:kelch-like protein 2 isoform X1 [Acyrthosiphon pisum]XP_016658901.1 kelch-like protein 2 isoform X1 [Acyrthosiphon pisum]XP_016658902.1 kelch-like protein 2 isoform X1 [Acyrthosiphon pisum]|eukprot:XP_016658900.1 PREDICTED: kelch-like protein 2 isoform X1 [Acyrthosiphon pisum]